MRRITFLNASFFGLFIGILAVILDIFTSNLGNIFSQIATDNKAKNQNLIGQFGIGRFSVYTLGSLITWETKAKISKDKLLILSMYDSSSFFISSLSVFLFSSFKAL